MSHVSLEQILYHRDDGTPPRPVAFSPGCTAGQLAGGARLVEGFGARPAGMRCPETLFAFALDRATVAVGRVADRGPLAFHLLLIPSRAYVDFGGDPFWLADQVPAVFEASSLPAVAFTPQAPPPRTVTHAQAILRRVKASALQEDEDPEAPRFERTPENSESPALLGSVQVLVDGGKAAFARPAGDAELARNLWYLLPRRARARLWPTTFAFSNELGFHLSILPGFEGQSLAGYTTEEQAADYPAGSYELALQTAVESGDQAALERVFERRDGHETAHLALTLLLAMIGTLVAASWLSDAFLAPNETPHKAATAAGIVAAGDPWQAAAGLLYGHARWSKP